jgi:hypothetical protein
MNILKLAKYLKEFTLEEISMIAEYDVKEDLQTLLKEGKLTFDGEKYKYTEKVKAEFGIFIEPVSKNNNNLLFNDAVNLFLHSHAKINCTHKTYRTYLSIFKMNILPFFKELDLNSIKNEDIIAFYKNCKQRNLENRRFKNTLALLNQLIKYFQNQGVIDKKCVFQVKRLTSKTKFSLNNIVIGKERGDL